MLSLSSYESIMKENVNSRPKRANLKTMWTNMLSNQGGSDTKKEVSSVITALAKTPDPEFRTDDPFCKLDNCNIKQFRANLSM